MQDPMQGGLASLEGVPNVGEEEFDISSLSEEELQQLVALGVIDEEMVENTRQMKLAEALRYQASPEGRNSGRVYTAASPLEHLGAGLQQYNAMKDMKDLKAARGAMGEKQTSGRGMYGDLLRGFRKKKIPIDTTGIPGPLDYEI